MNIKIFLKAFAVTSSILFASFTVKSSSIMFPANHITLISNDSIKILQLEERVKEIQGINFLTLSFTEKKNLRHELKQMLKEAKTYNQATAEGTHSGIYISVGALIIIILLLILILR